MLRKAKRSVLSPERTTERDHEATVCFSFKVYGTDKNVDDAVQEIALRVLLVTDVSCVELIDEEGNISEVDIAQARRLASNT